MTVRYAGLVLLGLFAAASCKTPPEPSGEKGTNASDAASAPRTTSVAPVNALPIPSASVAAEVNRENLPPYDGPTGSVEGTVYITGDPPKVLPNLDFSKCPDGAAIYGKMFRDGAKLPDGRRPLADAVVAVTGYSGFYIPETKESKQMVFDGCGFPSLTVAMTFGQRLDIVNKSKLVFAPELEQAPTGAVLVPPPMQAGDPVHIYPPHPGEFTLHDKVNALSYLRAEIIVMRQPLHAETDTSGHYRIDGVPVGKGLVVNTELPIIHQKASQKVDIVGGVVARVDLVLEYHAPPDAAAAPATGAPRLR
jgi:hypothetical protein